MQHVFNPERVCAKVFMIDIDEQTRTIRNFEFKGGCPGNLNGISRLIRGMHIDEVIERFADMPICPASKVTSCPEQLRKGLIELRDKLNAGEAPSRPSFVLDSFSFGKM
ncbi:MAG: TIGR03905 family TSCPD domain-containing protein [Mailhella sp.]|nr:TIGR03905 family TSCPD domain-containing protein [Mailhella sp.]MBQ3170503.1 TIGR03905 family TSCPD domain-containing protein [Mailhella sp.]MBQ4616096.1 TIGR03905 family TSCPD domain-containing protein [Mailhella sp.]